MFVCDLSFQQPTFRAGCVTSGTTTIMGLMSSKKRTKWSTKHQQKNPWPLKIRLLLCRATRRMPAA